MIYDLDENDDAAEEDVDETAIVPNYESEFFNAKSFLQKASTVTGENL